MNAIEQAAAEIEEFCTDHKAATCGRSVPRAAVIAAILSKHFPAHPKLIESGPLPEGRLIVGIPKPQSSVPRLIAFNDGAQNPNYDEFWFYDYGPLPEPAGGGER